MEIVTENELIKSIKELDNEEQITLFLSDGDTCEVGRADCWIGGGNELELFILLLF